MTRSRLRARGKVRDVYDAGEDRLLLVATDRISAFDVVLPDPIPDKGRVLTGLSSFWFEATADLVPHHVVSTDPSSFPSPFAGVVDIADLPASPQPRARHSDSAGSFSSLSKTPPMFTRDRRGSNSESSVAENSRRPTSGSASNTSRKLIPSSQARAAADWTRA